MNKLLFFMFVVLSCLATYSLISKADAKSGCCSWHGGVCGGSCCDGTSLSAKCGGYDYYEYEYYDPPRCPYNSSRGTDGACRCLVGYCRSVDHSYCVPNPANSHCVNSPTDAWLCDSGYVELNNSCFKQEVKKSTPITISNTAPVISHSSVEPEDDNTLMILFASTCAVFGGYVAYRVASSRDA